MDGRKLSFKKKLSTNDVTRNLEIPKKALHLPADRNESMHARERPNGRVWQFKCPERKGGRRYMAHQWCEFAKTKSLMKGDILRFYYSADHEDVYSVEIERRSIRLFGHTITILP